MTQETILLTGATGNVGAVTLDQLLTTTSHNVNAVIRKAEYSSLLEEKYPEQVANKRLSFTIVPDMITPGAFDAAASSATAIIHIATPLADDNWLEQMIKPTWEMDKSILEAAKKSSHVKRVIICGTILQTLGFAEMSKSDLVISEESWNPVTFEEAKNGPFHTAYPYSKTDAEKKTWAWVEQNGSSIGFDVVMLLPSLITGRSPQVNFKPTVSPGGIGQVYNALLLAKTAEAVDGIFPFIV
jgi:NADPH-dependent methylglyoxal reductase